MGLLREIGTELLKALGRTVGEEIARETTKVVVRKFVPPLELKIVDAPAAAAPIVVEADEGSGD